MINFEASYSDMLIDPFTERLHPDFKMILSPSTQDEWGWAADYFFDKATMELIHQNIFSGQPGLDANGNMIHPIDSIVIDLFELQGLWVAVPGDDPDFDGFDAWHGTFALRFSFWDTDFNHKFEVNGPIDFFVAPVVESGETYYLWLGARETPGVKAIDEATWDGVLSLYR